jgi:hypothetical protein
MTGLSHTLRHRGHLFSLTAEPSTGGTTVRLTVDGRRAATREARWHDPSFVLSELDGTDLSDDVATARITTSILRRGRLSGCRMVLPPDGVTRFRPERIPFEPPPGTRAHRRYLWQRRHPRLYAARHVALATAEVLGALLLARWAFSLDIWGWLPDLRLPGIRLPRIPWPDLPWPDLPAIPWPDLTLPAWLVAVLASREYWLPILVAVTIAAGEVRRRRRRMAEEAPTWPAPSTPCDTRPDDSRSSTPPSPVSPPTDTNAPPRP